MHLEETRDTFLLARARVVDIRASLQLTRIDTEEAETTYIRVGSDLEGKSRQRRAGVDLTDDFLLWIVGIRTDDLRRIHWAGQVSCDSVKERLYPLVLEGRTAEHGVNLHRKRTLTQGSTNFVFGDRRGIFEVLLHEDVVAVSEGLKHLVTPLFGFSLQFSRDVDRVVVSTHRLVVPDQSLHRDEVNDPTEGLFLTDRDLNRTRRSAEDGLDLADDFEEVSARAVHLIYVADTGHTVLVSLAPYRLTLRLYATYCTEGSDGTIEDTERTLYFDREVYVPRSVDQVDLVLRTSVVPESRRSSRGDRDTTLLLLLHPVHGSTPIVYFTDLMRQTGVEEDTFGRSGLPGIDVSHDADISC